MPTPPTRCAEQPRTSSRAAGCCSIEDIFDTDDLDEHDGEADLIALTCHGSGLRTAAELDAVIARAGLVRSATHTVGWGTTVHELVRADAN